MDKLHIKKVINTLNEMPKIRVYITVREDLVKWIDAQVKKLRFANRSHAFEYALAQLVEKEKSEKP